MRVLFIGAHPDDIEYYCGGTVAKCVKRGDTVICCHLSDGDMGHMIIEPKELGEIRCKESAKAGSIAGAEVIWGGFHDLDVYDNKEARDKVTKIVRYAKPDFIVTHNPDDYMPDHVAASKLVFDASFAASVPHYLPEAGEAINVVPIYYMDSYSGIGFIPELYVDITQEIETKKQMMRCHESQIKWLSDHDGQDCIRRIDIDASYRGYQASVEYAEGFRVCKAGLKIAAERLLP